MIHIGIDPDLQKSGVAVLIDGRYISLKSMTFPDVVKMISSQINYDDVLVTIEDVNAHKPTFSRGKQNQSVMNKISQNVGQVKAVGTLIVQLLEHHKCPYELIKPLTGLLKQAKDNKELFNRLTGWTGPSNADTRDAAMLIHRYAKKQEAA